MESEDQKVEKVIYVGPNDRKAGLRQYSIFIGPGFPPHVEHALEKNPGIARNFMDFADFVKRPLPGTPVKRTKVAVAAKLPPPIKRSKNFNLVTAHKK